MRASCVIALLSVLLLQSAAGAAQGRRGTPYVVDPVTKRIYQYCNNKPRCIAAQHKGIKTFLREITRHPRPSPARVQSCTRRATSNNLTDWTKAARCVR